MGNKVLRSMKATIMTSTDWARVADQTMMILMMLVIMLNTGDVYEDQKKSGCAAWKYGL